MRPAGERVKDTSDSGSQFVTAGDQRGGSRLPWTGRSAGNSFVAHERIYGFVEAQGADGRLSGISGKLSARSLRESNDRNGGMALSQLRCDARRWSNSPFLELCRRQAAGPAVEQLHRFRARFDLAREIVERHGFNPVDDSTEGTRVGVSETAGLALLPAALASDHVGGDRQGLPAKPISVLRTI